MDEKDSEVTFEVKLTKVWIIGVGSILGLGGGAIILHMQSAKRARFIYMHIQHVTSKCGSRTESLGLNTCMKAF